MRLVDLLLKSVYNKAFRQLLDVDFWPDASTVLTLSSIHKLELIEECNWEDDYEFFLSYLKNKYDDKGTCRSELYNFVSKDLRCEYDTIHCLIRSILEYQFK